MIYMTIKLMTVVMIYKVISLGPFVATASTLIIPFWFFLGDVITEVYGYKKTRQIIWVALGCQFLFALVCSGFVQLSSPPDWIYQEEYLHLFSKLPRVALASFLAIIIGVFLNSYLLAKWKIFFKGKNFWLRCLGATAIGELFFTVIAYLTEFWGVIAFADIFHLIMVSFGVKMLFSPILIIPTSLMTAWLKKAEDIDPQESQINFNPFILSADSK